MTPRRSLQATPTRARADAPQAPPLAPTVARRSLLLPQPPAPRRALSLPPEPALRRSLGPATLNGTLPLETWPPRVYGYHPLARERRVICIQKAVAGYFEVSPEIDPDQRNRELGVSRAVALAVIRAAWAPGGHVWRR